MKDKRVALYVRVGTGEQNLDLHLTELKEYAAFRKWSVAETYA
jgi:DNA invertase Pin-like site-specific DNA recombinase